MKDLTDLSTPDFSRIGKDEKKNKSPRDYQSADLPAFGGGKDWISAPSCKHPPTPVFDLVDLRITLWAAKRFDLTFDSINLSETLWLNCTGDRMKAKRSPILVAPDGWQDVADRAALAVNELCLDWDDRGAPPVGYWFWKAMLDKCRATGIKNIIAFCLGGHGRTGTALACLLVASKASKPEEAIKDVRRFHCQQAIESKAQEEYILGMK